MFHGGNDDFRQFDFLGIRDLTAGKPIIVVMPDGGHAGWYSNPVTSFVGPRNWETFHIAQLLPWIEANFRTFAEYDGRAVGGFSMGGFGALKYAAKYYGHFASVSAHSGPASLRRDFGLVVHWANITSAVLDLARRHGLRRAELGPGQGQRRQPGRADRELPEQADLPGRRHQSGPAQLVRQRERDPGARRPAGVPRTPQRTPASRMNRTRCPAATSSGPTCSHRPRRHHRPAAPGKQRRSRRRTRRYTLTSRVGRESGTRAEQLGNWSNVRFNEAQDNEVSEGSDTRSGCRRHFRRAVRRLLTGVRSSRRGFNCPRRRGVHVRRQRACDTGPNPDPRVDRVDSPQPEGEPSIAPTTASNHLI